jgi:hypothetical protein
VDDEKEEWKEQIPCSWRIGSQWNHVTCSPEMGALSG